MGLKSWYRKFRPKPKPAPSSTPAPNQSIPNFTPVPIGPVQRPSGGGSSGGSGGGSSGGGSSGGGGSSTVYQGPVQPGTDAQTFKTTGTSVQVQSVPSPRASTSVTQVQSARATSAFVSQEKKKDTLGRLSSSDPILRQSVAPGRLTAGAISNIKSSQQSTNVPTFSTIVSQGRGGEITADEYQYGTQKVLQKQYQDVYKRDYESAYGNQLSKEQDFVNQATTQEEADKRVIESNKRLNEFSKGFTSDWESGRGAGLQRQAGKIGFLTGLESDYLRTSAKVPSYLGTGAVTGAVVTGGMMGVTKVAPKLAGGLSKGLGIGAVAYGAYEFGSAGYKGFKTYSSAKDFGYDTKKSVAFGALGGGTKIAPSAFMATGALAGTGAVIGGKNFLTTGSIRGYTGTDITNIQRGFQKGAIKQDLVTGRTTDSVTNKISDGVLSDAKIGGSSLRKYTYSVDTSKLTPGEIKSFGKLNVRGSSYQSVTSSGKQFQGFEVGKIKTGGILGKKYNTFSTLKGVSTDGNVVGTRQFVRQSGRTTETGFEAFKGTGEVKYSNLFRGEASRGTSVKLFGSTTTPKSFFSRKGFTTTDTSKSFMGSKQGTVSEFRGYEVDFLPSSSSARGSKVYEDFAGGRGGKPLETPAFEFSKGPTNRAMKGFEYTSTTSSGGSSPTLQVKPVTSSPTLIPQSTSVKSLSPQVSTTQSPYYGQGTYEITNSPVRTLKRETLLVNVLNPQLGPQVKVRQGFLQPSAQIDFLKPSPQIRQGFLQPSAQIDFLQPSRGLQTKQLQVPVVQPARITGRPGFGITPTISPPVRPVGIPPFALPFGGERPMLGYGKLGGKQSFRYTPSFKAIAFDIRGKATKQTKFSGLELRPIVQGELFGGKKKSKKNNIFPTFRL